MPKITPFLWFDKKAEAAANLYASVFPKSKVLNVEKFGDAGPAGDVVVVTVIIAGQEVRMMDAGPEFKLTEAFSFEVTVDGQEEVDRYWNALTANGGEESQCGWLKDPFGVSWQIVPKQLNDAMGGPDKEGAARAMQAMLGMQKIIIADIEKAYAGS